MPLGEKLASGRVETNSTSRSGSMRASRRGGRARPFANDSGLHAQALRQALQPRHLKELMDRLRAGAVAQLGKDCGDAWAAQRSRRAVRHYHGLFPKHL